MIADIAPEEMLLSQLKESIAEYESAVTDSEKEEAGKSLQASLMMSVTKFCLLKAAKEEGKSAEDLLKDMDKSQKGIDLLTREDKPGSKN